MIGNEFRLLWMLNRTRTGFFSRSPTTVPGIDPALFSKALTMFQTLKPRDEVESTGMGLALVKRLVESAGGQLELKSPVDEGRGLSVAVRWPRRWPTRTQRLPTPTNKGEGELT